MIGLWLLAVAGGVVVGAIGVRRDAPQPAVAHHQAARALLVPPSPWWPTAERYNTPEAWDVAAAVYDDAAKRCMWVRPVGEHADCVDAAFAGVLARENAWSAEAARATSFSLDVQPVRVRALFGASDTFVVLAFPDDRGWMLNEFREAASLWSLRHVRVIAELAGERADRLTELRAGLEHYMAKFPGVNATLDALGFDPRQVRATARSEPRAP